MALLGFKDRFAPMVAAKIKRQTFRPPRKRPIKIGETIHLYAGLRTKHVRKLGTGRCVDYQKIRITYHGIDFQNGFCPEPQIMARQDGFLNWAEMRDWFRDQYGLPWDGVLIRWI